MKQKLNEKSAMSCGSTGMTGSVAVEVQTIGFHKYNSIDNCDRKKTINYIIQNGFSSGEWVSTLKIHGVNYSYWYNGANFKTAKRSGFIGEDETFFGDENFNYESDVKAMFEWFKMRQGFNTLVIFGEIYGGLYNHKDVPRDVSATKVQKEVQYRPGNDFIVFDIKLDNKYVGWDLVCKACLMFGFLHVPELGRGKFDELIKMSVDFPDPLHKELGFPEIKNNHAEGWVLKPVLPLFFGNGSRVILKGKSDKMKEISKIGKPPKASIKLSESGKRLCAELFTYLTENRLRNVLSHGEFEVTSESFGRLLGVFSKDAFDDFKKDFECEFNALRKKERMAIKKEMNKQAGDIIRPNFVDIMNRLY